MFRKGVRKMKTMIFAFAALFVAGCSSTQSSRWESSVNGSARVYTDKPQAVEYVDVTATLNRCW